MIDLVLSYLKGAGPERDLEKGLFWMRRSRSGPTECTILPARNGLQRPAAADIRRSGADDPTPRGAPEHVRICGDFIRESLRQPPGNAAFSFGRSARTKQSNAQANLGVKCLKQLARPEEIRTPDPRFVVSEPISPSQPCLAQRETIPLNGIRAPAASRRRGTGWRIALGRRSARYWLSGRIGARLRRRRRRRPRDRDSL
jgi:hypothetical protein